VSSGIPKDAVDHDVELLLGFVNTRDVETDVDDVAKPAQLAAWASEQAGLEIALPTAAEQAEVLALRESLRALMLANNGAKLDEDDLGPLREAAERCRFGPVVTKEGRVRLEPGEGGVVALEGKVLLALEMVQCLGAWPRLKACTAEDCQWAFYDTTRNRSRTWCSMDVCGNRTKTRRYRERRASD
jgi:predicted RNA-binding Zn ribbon-like protein